MRESSPHPRPRWVLVRVSTNRTMKTVPRVHGEPVVEAGVRLEFIRKLLPLPRRGFTRKELHFVRGLKGYALSGDDTPRGTIRGPI